MRAAIRASDVSLSRPADIDTWVDDNAPENFKFAKIPIPAKAFHGNRWKNCFVTVFDELKNLWKCVWSTENGWEMEDDDDNEEEERDIFISNREYDCISDQFEWLHR
jgi:hypothetical protein